MKCKKLISILMIIVLVVTINISAYDEVQADTLTFKDLAIYTSLFLAAGVTFTTQLMAETAVTRFRSGLTLEKRNIIENWVGTVTNIAVSVPDGVWNIVRDYVVEKYSVGTNTLIDNGTSKFGITNLEPKAKYKVAWVNAVGFYYGYASYDQPITVETMENGEKNLICSTGIYYVYNTATKLWDMVGNYSKVMYAPTDAESNIGLGTESQSRVNIPYSATATVDNPAYDYSIDGARSVAVPDASVDDWTWFDGKTQADVQNPPISEPIPDNPIDNISTKVGVITGLVEGISLVFNRALEIILGIGTAVGNILTSLGNIGTAVSDTITTKLGEIATTITGTISTTLTKIGDSVAQPDISEPFQNYGIPRLFLIFIDILLAVIRLIIRSIAFIMTIIIIQPSTELINDNIVSGLRFLKEQHLPVFGISLWDLFSAAMTTVISFYIVKRAKKAF